MQKYFHQCGAASAAVFVSTILVDSCNLIEPRALQNTKPTKVISGALIEGEWERLVGAIGMIVHEREFKGQLFRDNISFTTTPAIDGKYFFYKGLE
jgi:hypothetical protein